MNVPHNSKHFGDRLIAASDVRKRAEENPSVVMI